MKSTLRPLLLLAVAWSMPSDGVFAQSSDSPALGLPRIEGSGTPGATVAVPVSIDGATDFAVEVSDDLGTWQTLWNYTHRDGTNVLMVPDGRPSEGHGRYFRLRLPGDSIEDKRAGWLGLGIIEYRFRYQPRIGFCNCITSATVTVRNGEVVAVSDAVRATGFPEPDPNLGEFMSIEQLFDEITRYQRSSDNLWVRVQYDPINSYPVDVFLGTHSDWAHGFTITEFEILQRQ